MATDYRVAGPGRRVDPNATVGHGCPKRRRQDDFGSELVEIHEVDTCRVGQAHFPVHLAGSHQDMGSQVSSLVRTNRCVQDGLFEAWVVGQHGMWVTRRRPGACSSMSMDHGGQGSRLHVAADEILGSLHWGCDMAV